MATEAAAIGHLGKSSEFRAVGLVSSAHFVGHFHMLVVPPLFSLLTVRWGVNFIQLGLALTVYALVSVAAQLPMGYMADRFGSRKLLIGALFLGGVSLASIGIVDRYSWFLVAAGLSGIANAVYHPADYAILSARVTPSRIGRAFSVHTFAGMLGNALAPLTMLALVPRVGIPGALIMAGLVGPLVALPLIGAPAIEGNTVASQKILGRRDEKKPARAGTVFTPAILGMMVFFIVLSLSTSGLTNFSVPALMRGYGLPFATANLALDRLPDGNRFWRAERRVCRRYDAPARRGRRNRLYHQRDLDLADRALRPRPRLISDRHGVCRVSIGADPAVA